MKNYKEELQKIIEAEQGDTLKKYVAESWYNDLMQGGCQSGFIGDLIYYTGTHKFFDKYSNEILNLYQKLQQDGEIIPITNDPKNFLSWFGFEETAREISEELELFNN